MSERRNIEAEINKIRQDEHEELTPLLQSRESEGRPGHQIPRANLHGSTRFSLRSESTISKEEPEGPDGGWGWVVVISSFLCLSVLDGAGYTFGVFLDPLLVEMGGSRGAMSVAGSLLVATYAFTGPFAARLVSRFGTRTVCVTGAFVSALGLGLGSMSKNIGHIIVTYSIVTGLGFGMMYIPAIIAVANHFTKQRSFAIGICLCGAGAGTFVLSPLETAITDTYGWRCGFISLALLSLLCVLFGLTMAPVVREEWTPSQPENVCGEDISQDQNTCLDFVMGLIVDPALYHHPAFVLYSVIALADFTASAGLYVPFQYLPSFIMERGLDHSQAAYIISATGVCSTLGRLLAGWVSDRSSVHPLSLITLCLSLVLPPTFLLAVCGSFWTFFTCACLYGFLTGGWIALISPLFVRIMGLNMLTPAFGLLTGVQGIAGLIGPPMAGCAVDYFNDRRAALVVGALWMTISALIFFVANMYSARRDNRVVEKITIA